MNFHIKIIFIIVALFICNCSTTEISEKDFDVKISSPPKVTYCELANNLQKYSGQTIILQGVYMLQFEAPHFVTFSCQTQNVFVANFDAPRCSEESKIEPWDWSSSMTDRAHGVIIKGWFEGKIVKARTTGYYPEYYKFNVDCIDKVKQLGTLVVYPKNEAEKVKERIKQFEKED